MSESEVQYRDIAGFPSYRIGDDGSIWSFLVGGIWKRRRHSVGDKGYCYAALRKDGASFTRAVHRLVLESFVGLRPKGMQCRHLDGVPGNNRLSNLKWGTPESNVRDRKRHRQKYGRPNTGPVPNWPPRLICKPGTDLARTYHHGRWWNCGKWDAATNRPTLEAITRHLEFVTVWASAPGANPKGQPLAIEVLADWLASADRPTNQAERSWGSRAVDRLDEWKSGIFAAELSAAMLEDWQAWLCGLPAYNRTSVKKLLAIVRNAFVWGARRGTYGISYEQVFMHKSVPQPKEGRVREANIILPAPEADWKAAVAAARPQIAAILKLLWLTGARPNELLSVRMGPAPTRPTDEQKKWVYLQQSGMLRIPKVAEILLGVPAEVPVWAAHVRSKMKRKGHVRCLVFGPRAQEILAPIIADRQPGELLFSPKRAIGGGARRKKQPIREHYTHGVFSRAVKSACERAGVTAFVPYSIRHRASERIVAEMGREAEKAALGHGDTITDDYAGFNSTLAAKVAAAMG